MKGWDFFTADQKLKETLDSVVIKIFRFILFNWNNNLYHLNYNEKLQKTFSQFAKQILRKEILLDFILMMKNWFEIVIGWHTL